MRDVRHRFLRPKKNGGLNSLIIFCVYAWQYLGDHHDCCAHHFSFVNVQLFHKHSLRGATILCTFVFGLNCLHTPLCMSQENPDRKPLYFKNRHGPVGEICTDEIGTWGFIFEFEQKPRVLQYEGCSANIHHSLISVFSSCNHVTARLETLWRTFNCYVSADDMILRLLMPCVTLHSCIDFRRNASSIWRQSSGLYLMYH